MAISKVVYKSSPSATPVTWMDATTATAAEADIISPKTAMLANGVVTTGTGSGSGTSFEEFIDTSYPTGAGVINSATTIAPYVCAGRTGITSITSSSVTTIREYAFQGCTGLTSISLPNVTYLRSGATGTNTNTNGYFFQSCSNLETINMKNLEYIYGSYAFYNSFKANSVIVMPKLRTGSQRAFRDIGTGSILDFGENLTSLLADFLYYANSAKSYTLILRYTGDVVSAASADTIKGVTTLYVPSSLIASYQSASNWSTKYAAGTLTINAIEGSTYQTKYADGTSIS